MSKPPEPQLSTLQRFQKSIGSLTKRARETATDSLKQVSEQLQALDREHRVSQRVRETGASIDQRFDVSKKVEQAWTDVSGGVKAATSDLKRQADVLGVTDFVNEKVVDPARRVRDSVGSSQGVRAVLTGGEQLYGSARRGFGSIFVPNLPTYDAYELLQATTRELNYVAACILQIRPEESSQLGMQFSRAVTAKAAGADYFLDKSNDFEKVVPLITHYFQLRP